MSKKIKRTKDKCAAALKRKRRMEREAEENIKKDELYKRYREETRRHDVTAASAIEAFQSAVKKIYHIDERVSVRRRYKS